MSKRRAIVLSVTVEGLTQAETARLYSVSESTVCRLLARYRLEGDTAFEPKSRRPHTSPTRVADVMNSAIVNLRVDLTSRGLDAGPVTIQWHLAHAGHKASVSTIRRRLIAAELVTPEPKKRPKSSYIRFQADLPNETWQSDFTHYRLADSTDTEVLVWLDDHSRYALSVTAHDRVTGDLVVDTFGRDLKRLARFLQITDLSKKIDVLRMLPGLALPRDMPLVDLCLQRIASREECTIGRRQVVDQRLKAAPKAGAVEFDCRQQFVFDKVVENGINPKIADLSIFRRPQRQSPSQ